MERIDTSPPADFLDQSVEDLGSAKGGGNFNYKNYIPRVLQGKACKGDESGALIAVMGLTGSGKTTFISKVTGRDDLKIGHDLTSCTQTIQVVKTTINGQLVRLVDTPGFSDTHLSDTEVLQLIATYLTAAYKHEMKLSGIIYLHPISDVRITHHVTKNLDMFKKLMGENNLKNVILVTSMWDKVAEDDGARREDELKAKFWNVFLAMGAETARHDGSVDSASRIAHKLLVNRRAFYLRLQEEMGRENKPLRETAAGREVMADLLKMKEEHSRELAEMESAIKSATEQSNAILEAMKQQHQQTVDDLKKTLEDEKRMNEEAMKSLRERIQELEKGNQGGSCVVM